jgi:hypothetical protein
MRNLQCERIHCDEIWAFCYAKEKNLSTDKKGQFGYGDAWTWVGICADSKLIVSWMVAKRDVQTAFLFVSDLRGRLAHKIQLTTDGLKLYLTAVATEFGGNIDYAMLEKVYAGGGSGHPTNQ